MRTLAALGLGLSIVVVAGACKTVEDARSAKSAPEIPVASVTAPAPLVVVPAEPAAPPEPAQSADAAPVASRCEGVELELKADHAQGRQRFIGTLVNKSTKSFTLVEPGDGSAVGWRTPTITWKVTTLAGKPVPKQQLGRCGNVNPIQDSEIFGLAPHGRHVLDEWLGSPEVAPGKYVVRVVYENDPTAKISGIALGAHSSPALERIRKSTPCRVESNAITVDIASP